MDRDCWCEEPSSVDVLWVRKTSSVPRVGSNMRRRFGGVREAL